MRSSSSFLLNSILKENDSKTEHKSNTTEDKSNTIAVDPVHGEPGEYDLEFGQLYLTGFEKLVGSEESLNYLRPRSFK